MGVKLLLDLGNTRLKWALVQAGQWLDRGAQVWDENVPAALTCRWREQAVPIQVLGASVVDDRREAQINAVIAALFGLEVTWLHTPAYGCGVHNAYGEPQKLGVDRFLSMVAARHADRLPCVLVGIGTTLTLDALSRDGQHLGGLIAPGPHLMQRSLLGATVRVRPGGGSGKVCEVADNTADAMASGCRLAAVALIERFTARMVPSRLGTDAVLLLHGGDTELILPWLTRPARHVSDSVLCGLAVWAGEMKQNVAGGTTESEKS